MKKTIMEYYYEGLGEWEKEKIGNDIVRHCIFFRYQRGYLYRLLVISEIEKDGKVVFIFNGKKYKSFWDAKIAANNFGYKVIRGIISRWKKYNKEKI